MTGAFNSLLLPPEDFYFKEALGSIVNRTMMSKSDHFSLNKTGSYVNKKSAWEWKGREPLKNLLGQNRHYLLLKAHEQQKIATCSFAAAKSQLQQLLKQFLTQQEYSQIDWEVSTVARKIYRLCCKQYDHLLPKYSLLYFKGKTGEWRFCNKGGLAFPLLNNVELPWEPENFGLKHNQVFNSRPQIVRAIHDFLSHNLYQVWNEKEYQRITAELQNNTYLHNMKDNWFFFLNPKLEIDKIM